MSPRILKTLVLGATLPVLYLADVAHDSPFGLTLVRDAQAIVGAPLTPLSVAGVARRTTRRVVAVETTAAAATAAAATTATAEQQAATAKQHQTVAQQQAATAQQQAATAQQQAAASRCAAARQRGQRVARRLHAGDPGRCRVPEVRHRLLSGRLPGKQPRLHRRTAMTQTAPKSHRHTPLKDGMAAQRNRTRRGRADPRRHWHGRSPRPRPRRGRTRAGGRPRSRRTGRRCA